MLIHLAAFVVVVAGIMAAKSILIPFLLASFLAIICAPPLYWLRSKGVPNIFFGASGVGGILLVTFLLLLTKFVWNKFERALPSLKGE